MQQQLLPQTLPRNWAPALEPRPMKHLRPTSPAAAPCTSGLPMAEAETASKPPLAATAGERCILAPPLPVPIPRRASTTPRLVPQPLLEEAPADFLA